MERRRDSISSVQGAAEAEKGEHGKSKDEQAKGRQLVGGGRKGSAFQHDGADHPQEVSERQNFADRLRPAGHAEEGEHESGKKDRGQEKEK